MGKINSITKQTDNRYVNLYNVKATSVHNTPVNYFVASRARDVESLKLVTRKNKPDGVIIYSIYGENHDKVVLIRQYRYTLGDYIYEFPAGLVEPDENYHEGAVREMYEETGLKLEPIPVAEAYQKPYFTTVGMIHRLPLSGQNFRRLCQRPGHPLQPQHPEVPRHHPAAAGWRGAGHGSRGR